jgi:heme-degrading monooxygenase HmoA
VIAVIFEICPKPGGREGYLEMAAQLGTRLSEIDGFISVERFQSLVHPEKLLSLSFWRDEAAVARWRNLDAHRGAQSAGRAAIFEDYRLRIATVVRDYGMNERSEAPADSRGVHG